MSLVKFRMPVTCCAILAASSDEMPFCPVVLESDTVYEPAPNPVSEYSPAAPPGPNVVVKTFGEPVPVTVTFEMGHGGVGPLPYVTFPTIEGVFAGVGVFVAVLVDVCVEVGVNVAVTVGVAVFVGVNVGENVAVGVLVAVAVGADVGVFVGVTLGVPIGPSGRGHTNAPRPRVQSDSVVLPRSIVISQIITAGSPLLNRNHCGAAALMSFVK